MKKKRLTFRCGRCTRTFSFQREITPEQEWFFTCPFCGAELVLKLDPYKTRSIDAFRSVQDVQNAPEDWDYDFPDVIPASPR